MKELLEIQTKLKVPKGQRNDFGKYNYRNVEDIQEALKPLLAETKTTIKLSDEIMLVGDRFYVKATATLTNGSGDEVTTCGYAREALSKKGMDESQITGAASSYARKYALNGLLAIDDTKDADSFDNRQQNTNKQTRSKPQQKAKSQQPAKPNPRQQLLKALGDVIKTYQEQNGDVWQFLSEYTGKEITKFSDLYQFNDETLKQTGTHIKENLS